MRLVARRAREPRVVTLVFEGGEIEVDLSDLMPSWADEITVNLRWTVRVPDGLAERVIVPLPEITGYSEFVFKAEGE